MLIIIPIDKDPILKRRRVYNPVKHRTEASANPVSPLYLVFTHLQAWILLYISDYRPITSFAARLLNKLIRERD